jgi:hypothetical protein
MVERPRQRDGRPARGGITAAYRLPVLSRAGAAAFGGYAFAAALSILLSRILPMPRAEAVLTGTMLGFIIYLCAILWAFAVPSPRRAWLGLLIPTLVCGVASWLLGAGAPI